MNEIHKEIKIKQFQKVGEKVMIRKVFNCHV